MSGVLKIRVETGRKAAALNAQKIEWERSIVFRGLVALPLVFD